MLLGEAVESCTPNGESPIAESITSSCSNPSSIEHMKPRVNQQGPPFKAKYSWEINYKVVPQLTNQMQAPPWVDSSFCFLAYY